MPPTRLGALAAAALVAAILCATATLATAQVARALPRCLSTEQARKYGWMKPENLTDTSKFLQQPAASVTLEINGWASSNLTTYVAGMLLRDVMGVDVKMVEYGGAGKAYKRISEGATNASLEIWPSSKVALYTDYVVRQGVVIDGGMTGYTGKIAWYVNSALTEAQPQLIFDSWRSFTNPAVLAYFPAAGSTPAVRNADGSFLCDTATYPFCTNGMFVPPQCQGALMSTCKEFWHVDPGYSQGEVEQRIVTLGLKLVVVYLGPAFETKVAACARQGATGCLFYYWTPEILPSVYNFSMVNLPQFRSECYGQFSSTKVGAADNYLTCDWTVELLMKIVSASVRNSAPHVSTFLTALTLRDTDMNALLRGFYESGSTTDTACAWIQANSNQWASWVPLPPAGYIRYLDQLEVSDALSVIVLVGCAILLIGSAMLATMLFRLKSEPSLRAQSPVFIGVILFGVCLVCIGVILETIPASTSICIARIRLLSIGVTIILASTLAKTSRIYAIFGNKRMQAKSMSNRRLLMAVVVLSIGDIILQVLWSELGHPQVETTSVSLTTYTWTCGMDFVRYGAAASATMAVLYAYHVVMLAGACWLSYKVRHVASAFNEAKYIALASYLIMFTAIVVLPVVYLPINFRAQFIIKCLMILFALYGVCGLMVVRPIVEAITLRSMDGSVDLHAQNNGNGKTVNGASTVTSFVLNRTASNKTAALPHDATAASTNSSAPLTAAVKVADGIAIRKVGGLFRQWLPVSFVLMASPRASLQVVEDGKGIGTTYTTDIFAEPLTGSLHDRLDGCFMLTLGARAYLVQTASAADADNWIKAINESFAHSPRNSRSSSVSQRKSRDGQPVAKAPGGGSGTVQRAPVKSEPMTE
ncbi:hypothetical protein H9P43_005106 [Blastocladiella emersonii ATCC 22665]|nr:hypothetical protein H9P43_005106 [Blastocladiella emersonii ATCC 22665]